MIGHDQNCKPCCFTQDLFLDLRRNNYHNHNLFND